MIDLEEQFDERSNAAVLADGVDCVCPADGWLYKHHLTPHRKTQKLPAYTA